MARKSLHDRMKNIVNQLRAGKLDAPRFVEMADDILADYKRSHAGDAVREIRHMFISHPEQRRDILLRLRAGDSIKTIAQEFYEHCLKTGYRLKATGKGAAYNTTLQALRHFHTHCMEYDMEQAEQAERKRQALIDRAGRG